MDCIQPKKFFDDQCDKVGSFFDKNPLLYKITLVAIHIISADIMFTYMSASPHAALLLSGAILIRSLVYRCAVERFCTFRFSLPSLIGATTIWALPTLGPLPIVGYLISVLYISHTDVENLQKKLSCCH